MSAHSTFRSLRWRIPTLVMLAASSCHGGEVTSSDGPGHPEADQAHGLDFVEQGTIEPADAGTAAADAGTADAAPSDTAPSDAAQPPEPCRPPRYYTYTILPGDEKLLKCTPVDTDIMSVQVPDLGRALARATLVFRNNHASQIYYWSASIVVGTGDIAYNVGDDVCPNTYTTPPRRILGLGTLTAANGSLVRVRAHQGSAPCVDDQIGVFSGGTLEVWVEDERPDCAGKDLDLVSTYQTMGTNVYDWTTAMTEILSLPLPPSSAQAPRSQITVMGAVEGTPLMNPNNVCGLEAETLVSQIQDNVHGVLDTSIDVIPASQGMGHLVLSNAHTGPLTAGMSSVSLWVGSNTALTTVQTGGCCGDAKVGFVKHN